MFTLNGFKAFYSEVVAKDKELQKFIDNHLKMLIASKKNATFILHCNNLFTAVAKYLQQHQARLASYLNSISSEELRHQANEFLVLSEETMGKKHADYQGFIEQLFQGKIIHKLEHFKGQILNNESMPNIEQKNNLSVGRASKHRLGDNPHQDVKDYASVHRKRQKIEEKQETQDAKQAMITEQAKEMQKLYEQFSGFYELLSRVPSGVSAKLRPVLSDLIRSFSEEKGDIQQSLTRLAVLTGSERANLVPYCTMPDFQHDSDSDSDSDADAEYSEEYKRHRVDYLQKKKRVEGAQHFIEFLSTLQTDINQQYLKLKESIIHGARQNNEVDLGTAIENQAVQIAHDIPAQLKKKPEDTVQLSGKKYNSEYTFSLWDDAAISVDEKLAIQLRNVREATYESILAGNLPTTKPYVWGRVLIDEPIQGPDAQVAYAVSFLVDRGLYQKNRQIQEEKQLLVLSLSEEVKNVHKKELALSIIKTGVIRNLIRTDGQLSNACQKYSLDAKQILPDAITEAIATAQVKTPETVNALLNTLRQNFSAYRNLNIGLCIWNGMQRAVHSGLQGTTVNNIQQLCSTFGYSYQQLIAPAPEPSAPSFGMRRS